MKPKSRNLLSIATIFVSLAGHAAAAEIVRDNTGAATLPTPVANLSDPLAWVGGVIPGANDIAVWNNTVATGANTVATLGSDMTWDGIKVVNPAAVVVINAGNTLTLDGGAGSGTGIDLSAATQNLTITAPLVLAGNQTWNVGTGRTVAINGNTAFNQGSSAITQNGVGTVLFNTSLIAGQGIGTGTFIVNRGTLQVTSPSQPNIAGQNFLGHPSILSPGTALVMGGGTFHTQTGDRVGDFFQNFASLTLQSGGNVMTQGRGSSSKAFGVFGSISRNPGGTLNLFPTSNASGFRVTSGLFPIELVSGGIILNSTDFVRAADAATNMGNAIYVPDTWAIGNRTNVTVDSAQTDATTDALRFAAVAARTITLSGTNTITSGGLLVTAAVAANPTSITGGILRGGAGADLIVHQFNGNAAGALNISSEIADNASATALTKTGGGTLTLSGNNTFTGGVFLNQGNLQLGSAGSLNSTTPNSVTITNNSSGRLILNGTSATVSGLNTSETIAATIPIVENVNATGATLTISNAAANLFAGTIQDGVGGGKLGLTKSGAGVLTLSGASTAYTGNTTISLGTLALSGTAVPGTANTVAVAAGAALDVTARTGASLTLANGQNLTGSGGVIGGIVTGAGSSVTPGSAGVGTLTATALTVGGGSVFNLEVSPGSTDLVDVIGLDGLAINGGSGLNLYVPGTTNKLQTNGTYQLFKYNGTIQGDGVAALTTANILNPQGGLSYSFAEAGGFVEMTVTGVAAPTSVWSATGSGSWGDTAKWDNATIPNVLGATANLNGAIGSASVVTLDDNRQIGALVLNSALGYTISSGIPDTSVLTLNNGAGNTTIDVINGSHTISAPLELLSNTSITVANLADTLTLSGIVSDGGTVKGITKFGLGTLDFASAFETPNTFSGGLTIAAGTVRFNALDSLGSDFITVAGGTLMWAAAMPDDVEDISTRVVTIGSGGATFDTNGNDVTFIGGIGSGGVGGLTKAGAGTLTIGSGNDFSGGVVVKAGTLLIADDSGLGAIPGAPGTKLTFNPGTGNTSTLKLGVLDVTINPNRGILISNGTGEFDTNGVNGTFTGLISGTGRLKKSGEGILTVTGVNNVNASGGTTIDAGTLFVNNEVNLPSGGLIMNGNAILSTNGVGFYQPQVNGTNTIIERPEGGGVIVSLGALTGTGSLTVTNAFVTDYVANSWEGFNGTIILGGGTRLNGTAGSVNVTLNLANHGLSVRDGRTAITIGEVNSPDPLGFLGGSTGGGVQTVTYSIGGKNTPSLFAGTIGNGAGPVAINKVGTNSLTLSGTSTHTGASTVTAGSLVFNGGGFAVGALTVVGSATLTGNATLAAVTVAATGNLAPGIAGIGAMTTGATTLQGNLLVEVDGASDTADTLAVAGHLNLAGSVIDVSVLNGPLTQPAYVFGSYTTISGSGTVIAPPGYRVDYNYQGLNQLALTTAPLSPFESWAAGFGLFGGDAVGSGDFDHDGINNLLEFILGGNPTISDTSILPDQNTADPNTLVFTYLRSDASQGIAQTVEVSTDLADWATIPPITIGLGNSSGIGYTVDVQPNGGDPDLITVTIQRNGNTSLFARLKAVN